jgi:hypothetical protein
MRGRRHGDAFGSGRIGVVAVGGSRVPVRVRGCLVRYGDLVATAP